MMQLSNKLYWEGARGFGGIACGNTKAAKDLGYNVNDVRDAYTAVDIIPCQNDILLYKNLSGSSETPIHFKWEIPLNTSYLRIGATVGTGDVKVYIRRGTNLMSSEYVAVSARTPNIELVELVNPKPGTYYITLSSCSSFAGVGFFASLKTSYAVPIVENLDSCDNKKGVRLTFTLPAVSSRVILSGKTAHGTAEVYLQYGKPADMKHPFPKLSLSPESARAEICNAKAGEYHLLIVGGAPFNGTTISSTFLREPVLIV